MRYWSVVSTMAQTYEVCMERDLSVFENLSVYIRICIVVVHSNVTFHFLLTRYFARLENHQNKIIAEIFLDILFT